ncbi:hypothetical protein PIB30_001958 [Stylosanthes scabra]|uniref:BHLH domain-containing protein n=1 Tax=Stylosanthes scabra TaxID=79078 RepID=A0ABU6Y4T4_9FABA|nr:hypothetical protein [Stylosanthes scabra]
MAEGCGGNSVATTSPTSFNWWYLHANHHAWNNNNNNSNNNSNHQTNPNSSSCSCEEDISVSTSFTNASNHSSLTVDSSRRLLDPPPPPPNHFFPEHADDNHLWSHVLSSNGELQNNEEIGEKFLDALSSKNMTSSMFEEPAYCDYLKKLDSTSNSWEYSGGNGGGGSSSSSFNNNNNNSFDEKNNNNGFSDALIENNERLTKLSNLVSTWSIAPPHPQLSTTHFEHPPPTNNNNQNQFPQSHDPNCNFKQQLPFIGDNSTSSYNNPNINISSYDQMSKVKEEYHHHHHQNGLLMNGVFSVGGDSISGNNKLYHHGLPNISSCTRNNNISDVISFNSRLGMRPVLGIHAQKASMKYMNLSEPKKHQPLQTSSPINRSNNNGRIEGTTTREVKKKRSEESSEAILKKPKQDTSTASSTKVQAPKVKLGDKITALQQIVSPFGKTDTASVLFEAIGYIKFLQEQVQLLSNPYLKSNSHKDPWGSLDRKDHQKEDGKLDLRSRGLCLVPTSCTALVYRENSGPDYWTPAYRGCLYR